MNKITKFLIYETLYVLYLVGLGRKIEDVSKDSNSLFVHDTSYGGRYKYLTSLDMLLQLVFFGLSSIDSLIELLTNKSYLKCALSFVYKSLVFPFGAFVAISFWAIYVIDRQLIFPTEFDAVIPGWHNHIMHTLPLISSLIESALNKHEYCNSFLCGVLPTILAGVSYLTWVLIIAYYGGFWVYPVMEVLSPFQRLIFFFVLSIVLASLYKMGQIFNDTISNWNNKIEKTKKK